MPHRSPRVLDFLASLLLLGSVAVGGAVAVMLVNPAAVPGAWRAPAEAAVAVANAAPPTDTRIAPTEEALPTWPATWTLEPTATEGPSPTPLLPSGLTPLPSPTDLPGGFEAQVAAHVGYLRLRQRPSDTSAVIGSVAALTPLDIIGRTPDSAWLEIFTPDQRQGWVMTQYTEVFINLQAIPVTAQSGPQASATPFTPSALEAQVNPGGQGLRVRQAPGTAGVVLASLDALTPLDLLGRTADNDWLQVVAQTSQAEQGWVMRQYVDVFIAVEELPVTGQTQDATAPPSTASATPRAGNTTAAATATATRPAAPTATNAPGNTNTPPPTAAPPTQTPAPSNTPLPPPSSTPGQPPSGLPDPRLYLSGVSQHSRDIYLAGQARGNRADVFSKVGDSITVYWQFLIRIGQSKYNLRDYGYLEEATQHFMVTRARNGNSYVNTSLAAKSGWSSFAVLAPSLADKTYCQSNESPLMCEYRLTRPAIALIMLGTNDIYNRYSNEGFEANLRRIVSDSIAMGVIPVLSTVPPFQLSGFEGRTEEINALIVKVAQETDVPLWDYHAALLTLPNQGLGDDGVHPSFAPDPADFTADNLQYGFALRNLLALHVLDTLWRQVLYP